MKRSRLPASLRHRPAPPPLLLFFLYFLKAGLLQSRIELVLSKTDLSNEIGFYHLLEVAKNQAEGDVIGVEQGQTRK